MRRYTCLLWISLIALHLSGDTEAMYSVSAYNQEDTTTSTTTSSTTSTTTASTTTTTTDPTTSTTTASTTSTTTDPTTTTTTDPTTSTTTDPTTSTTTDPTTSTTTASTTSTTTASTTSTTTDPTTSTTTASTTSTTTDPTTSTTTASTTSTTTDPTTTTTTDPTTSTTTDPTTSTTTASTTSTTTDPTTSTTTASTTSTTTDPTTSTTTASTTSTTTASTTSTTTDPTTTTPVPIEDRYDFVVKGENGKPCIASTMTINLNVQYKTKEGTQATKQLQVPKKAQTSGSCIPPEKPSMILTWQEPVTLSRLDPKEINSVVIQFLTKDSRISIDRIGANIYLDKNNFPDAAADTENVQLVTGNGLGLFSASTTNSIHKCATESKVSSNNGEFAISDVTLLPIKEDTNINNLAEENCVKTEEAGVNTGAIIGGVVGGVVVVSIIGFVIWRRRKQSREQRSTLANTDKYL